MVMHTTFNFCITFLVRMDAVLLVSRGTSCLIVIYFFSTLISTAASASQSTISLLPMYASMFTNSGLALLPVSALVLSVLAVDLYSFYTKQACLL